VLLADAVTAVGRAKAIWSRADLTDLVTSGTKTAAERRSKTPDLR
jgi:hypothetical protein